jgi:chemotaxis protein MotB
VTEFGGAKGGIIGLGLGAATGAIAADYLYPPEEGVASAAQLEELNSKLQAANAEISQMRAALEQEQSQRQALLEAHEKVKGELDSARSKMPSEIEITKEPDGSIKLTILSEVLFASGKAQLTSQGESILQQAAQTIQSEWPEAPLEIRGHTDNEPIRQSNWPSNWELSCGRALSVLHYFMDQQGFTPERLMVSGFADTQPVAENDTSDGRQKNRRAEIVIRPKNVQMAER